MSTPYILRFLRGRSVPPSVPTTPPAAGAPLILYTDLLYGPKSGAPGGGGALLSIFGLNFGSNINNVSVTVGGGAVQSNIYLGASLGRSDIQQLAVQLGASCATGAVKVTVSGVDSNTNNTFTVTTGSIVYYSSALPTEGQISAMSAGDVAVVRGGTYDAEIYFHTVTGSAGLPLTVMGYPGEDVHIARTSAGATAVHVFYSGANGTQGFYQICGFRCTMGWDHVSDSAHGSSIIGMGVDLQDIRVVNNECADMYENAGGSAAISGSGTKLKAIGNYCHDNGGSKLYHALYFDARAATPTDYEIAFNHVARQYGGRGLQVFGDSASPNITNVKVHHNIFHDIHLDGVLFGDKSTTGFEAYNNIIYNTANDAYVGPASDSGAGGGACGIRFNNPGLVANVHDNTLYNCAVDGVSLSAGWAFDDASASGLTLRNNITSTSGGAGYYRGTPAGKIAVSTNNLWHNSGATPSFDSNAQNGNPNFVNPGTDFHLQNGSIGIDAGTATGAASDDYEGTARPQGSANDIGAYERAA